MSRELDINALIERLARGDRGALAKAITLVESQNIEHQKTAHHLLAQLPAPQKKSWRVAISGVPGVGKSTFIDALGSFLVNAGNRVAVLAIDPTSEHSKGSILGDKTRMERLAALPEAFIRPSPSSGTLGGVGRSTRETIALCETAGFDVILVETVGVGQSETLAHGMTDVFLLLVLASAGDELQGIKRGIMEMADLLIINKDDGPQAALANQGRANMINALHLFPSRPDGWQVPVLTASAIENRGLKEIWAKVTDYLSEAEKNGQLAQKRAGQERAWLHDVFQNELILKVMQHQAVNNFLESALIEIENGSVVRNLYPAIDAFIADFLTLKRD